MKRNLAVFFCLSLPAASTFADVNSCLSLASTLKEYNISNQSSAFLNSAYDQYCDQSGNTKSTSAGIGLDMVIKAIPIKFTGNYSSSAEAFKNFCRNYSSVATASERKFSYEEKIATKSLETIEACQRIAALGATVTHEIPNMRAVTFFLQNGNATKLEVRGVFPTPNDGVVCEGQIDGQLKTFSKETFAKVESTQGISCERVSKSSPSGVGVFEEQVITLATNLGNYSVFLPQDEKLPLEMAQNISSRIDKLENEGSALSSKTTTLESDLAQEKASLRYIFVENSVNCPQGWNSQGVIGWIMRDSDYANNVGNGGRFNTGWTWTHPKLCKR
ncbi:hypothetical protein ACEU59_21360 [Buttiauxella noackiae]|uniref:hypothetical protein n=1 Tax=Buttiauxella noackiae TaxID=82992 RepID=UPI0035A59F4E